jgi:anaerobic selenocysteine-containing dehydrogenase
MNPEDALARGLETSQKVHVWNDLGSVYLQLFVSKAVMPGVVSSEKGAWLLTSENGQTISALVSADERADLAHGACYNDTGVEVALA